MVAEMRLSLTLCQHDIEVRVQVRVRGRADQEYLKYLWKQMGLKPCQELEKYPVITND